MPIFRNIAFFTVLLFSSAAVAQGSLEPVAPPSPTMKTLDQVEARIPISTPGNVSSPGSYYLTNDITGNINVTADHVDIDLNGFTISTGVGNHIIDVGGQQHIRIHNGHLVNGISFGIIAAASGHVYLHDLTLVSMENSCVNVESPIGPIHIERVHCQGARWSGFYIRQTGTNPLYLQLRDSSVTDSNLATNATYAAFQLTHIGTGEMHVVITGNRAINNRTSGFSVTANNGPALPFGQVTDNLAQGGLTGFFINGDFLFARNMAVGNSTNYTMTNSRAAPVSVLSASTGAWDNISE